jgi:hypothetical protein
LARVTTLAARDGEKVVDVDPAGGGLAERLQRWVAVRCLVPLCVVVAGSLSAMLPGRAAALPCAANNGPCPQGYLDYGEGCRLAEGVCRSDADCPDTHVCDFGSGAFDCEMATDGGMGDDDDDGGVAEPLGLCAMATECSGDVDCPVGEVCLGDSACQSAPGGRPYCATWGPRRCGRPPLTCVGSQDCPVGHLCVPDQSGAPNLQCRIDPTDGTCTQGGGNICVPDAGALASAAEAAMREPEPVCQGIEVNINGVCMPFEVPIDAVLEEQRARARAEQEAWSRAAAAGDEDDGGGCSVARDGPGPSLLLPWLALLIARRRRRGRDHPVWFPRLLP